MVVVPIQISCSQGNRACHREEQESQSELLEDAGEQLTEQGLEEVVASEELSEAGKEIRAEGVTEIAIGAEEVGEAETAEAVAEELK